MRKITLMLFFLLAVLTGCSLFEKNNLQKFSDGELATWRYMDESSSSEEKDCSKVIENANGLIFFQFVKDGKLISYSFWGRKTGRDKFLENKSLRNIAGKDAGSITYFQLKEKNINGGSLTLTAVRDDGLISENYFNISENKSLQSSGWKYLNPTELQARQFEKIKQFVVQKNNLNVCKVSTLLDYFKKSEEINEKLPESHLYLGSRLIDITFDDPNISDPKSLEKELHECQFLPMDTPNPLIKAIGCKFERPSVGFNPKPYEYFNLIALTPNCCLTFVDIFTNRISLNENLDLFKSLPGVEKVPVSCDKLTGDNSRANFYEVTKNGMPKFSVREILEGGSGGNRVTTTVYYGMPKIDCSRIADLDNTYK